MGSVANGRIICFNSLYIVVLVGLTQIALAPTEGSLQLAGLTSAIQYPAAKQFPYLIIWQKTLSYFIFYAGNSLIYARLKSASGVSVELLALLKTKDSILCVSR